MTEENLNALRQMDANLRKALMLDDAERPQFPADLNERLMQRVINEEKKSRRIVWPWIAAACVAGVVMMWLVPPKFTNEQGQSQESVSYAESEQIRPKVKDTPKDVVAENTIIEPPAPSPTKNGRIKTTVVKHDAALLAQETPVEETPVATATSALPNITEAEEDLATIEITKPQEKMVTLTERDIPITRPENLQLTPEEIALLKKQANEAYLKWAQQELDIAKYTLEQIAQK